MKIKEMIVVEGRDDTVAIQRAVDADTIETNGSALNETTLRKIELANERRGVIVFTDPDYPGERIRKLISERIPGLKHAFLPKGEAISKDGKDLGVENASIESIRRALKHAREAKEHVVEEISWHDLIAAGLIAGSGAKERRELLGRLLRIGYANGKQLHKRLLAFRITKEEFTEAYLQVLQEEEEDERYCDTKSNEGNSSKV